MKLITPAALILVIFVQSWTSVTCQSQYNQREPQDEDTGVLPGEFAPVVSAICRGGTMVVTVNTSNPFYGVLPASNKNRTSPECFQEGAGSKATQISFSMNALPGDSDDCGMVVNNRTGEKSIQVAVRVHRTLELAEDRQYVVTCGKPGNRNNEPVRMGFYHGSKHLTEVVHGRQYNLKVEKLQSSDSSFRVRSCFGFGNNDNSVALIDDNGCPGSGVISTWTYSSDNRQAEATIYSMFRFPHLEKLNVQCEVLFCQESQCPNPQCDSVPATEHAVPQRQKSENSVLVSASASVLEPGEKPDFYSTDECFGYPNWLLWLAIILGVLFVIMLLINLFLCSALTCTCTRTELIEKEPSVLEDYDPYRSWAGSQHGGSRYSLNGANKPIDSISAESNGGSDHYATVPSRHSPSRPGSRYSNNIRSAHGGSPYSGGNRKMMY